MLIENGGAPGSINHLGVEVASTEEVIDATKYLGSVGFGTRIEEATTCCYASQDKVWVDGIDGSPWEVYTVLDDNPPADALEGDGTCCTSDKVETSSASSCC